MGRDSISSTDRRMGPRVTGDWEGIAGRPQGPEGEAKAPVEDPQGFLRGAKEGQQAGLHMVVSRLEFWIAGALLEVGLNLPQGRHPLATSAELELGFEDLHVGLGDLVLHQVAGVKIFREPPGDVEPRGGQFQGELRIPFQGLGRLLQEEGAEPPSVEDGILAEGLLAGLRRTEQLLIEPIPGHVLRSHFGARVSEGFGPVIQLSKCPGAERALEELAVEGRGFGGRGSKELQG